jgi:hypothetical protein
VISIDSNFDLDSDYLLQSVMDDIDVSPPAPPLPSLLSFVIPQPHPSLLPDELSGPAVPPPLTMPTPSIVASTSSTVVSSAQVAPVPTLSVALTIINMFHRYSAYSQDSYMTFSDGLDVPNNDPWGDTSNI